MASGERDRESSLRICPTVTIGGKDPAKQFNIELPPADATASPHLSLAVIIWAGLEGIRAKLPSPPIFSVHPTNSPPQSARRWAFTAFPAAGGCAYCLAAPTRPCGCRATRLKPTLA